MNGKGFRADIAELMETIFLVLFAVGAWIWRAVKKQQEEREGNISPPVLKEAPPPEKLPSRSVEAGLAFRDEEALSPSPFTPPTPTPTESAAAPTSSVREEIALPPAAAEESPPVGQEAAPSSRGALRWTPRRIREAYVLTEILGKPKSLQSRGGWR